MSPVKYHVEIANVREVSIVGDADLAMWRRRLQGEGLRPTIVDGRAQLVISAVDAKFMGIRFREMSLSVFVSQHGDDRRDGAFLAHAFNSVRFFAWVERTMFRTPYWPARLEVSCQPASFKAAQGGRTLIEARRAAKPVPDLPLWVGEDGWQGPIYLPARFEGDAGSMFHGKIGGRTQVFPFGTDDVLRMLPTEGNEPLAWFIDSDFTPREWHIRESARHGKSKTVPRG
jgi:hypothetical protein